MATLVIPGAYQVTIKGSSGGQEVQNVVGIAAAPGQVALVAAQVAAAWSFTGGPITSLPTVYTFLGVRAVDLSSPTGAVHEIGASEPGGSAGALATNGSCAIISYNGGTRSRSSSGRLYHGPLRESQIEADGRTLSAAAITALDNCYQTFKDQIELLPMQWVVLSRKLSSYSVIGTPQTQAIIGTQRRRIR